MEQSDPSTELAAERHQLWACRWGFLLIGAGLFLQLALMILPVFWQSPADVNEERTPPAYAYLMVITSTLATLAPGAFLLRQNARSGRWRNASTWLLVACVWIVGPY